MNVLIKFEDEYGCYSLFNYCKSVLNNEYNDITNGWGCNGVFNLNSVEWRQYDYIILIFDMDDSEKGLGCLTVDVLKQRLEKFSGIGDNDVKVRMAVQNKLILIPVFFCFETIPLFS